MKKVCVVGLGYIGLPTAAILATYGCQVLGVDINRRLLQSLEDGQVHVQEPGLKDLIGAVLASGKLRLAGEPEPADAFIIAVPTPSTCDGHRTAGDSTDGLQEADMTPRADLSYVVSAAESIVPYLRPGTLVVLESTVPPRTTVDVVGPILRRSGLTTANESARGLADQRGRSRLEPADILVAHCPERVLPGRILEELVHNDRIIGGVNLDSAESARDLYASFVKGAILLTDATTAEMVKLMENTYRDVNIALANELALVAEQVGIDAWDAINLANHHPRVNILKPGPGVGGHCIAVDPWFIVEKAPCISRLISTARRVNDAQPLHVLEVIRQAVADLDNPTVAILGLAYKANVDDLRESPAFRVAQLVEDQGWTPRLHDACASKLPDGTPLEPDVEVVLAGADVAVVLTDHQQYHNLKPWDSGPLGMAHRRMVDTRACLDQRLWEECGFSVHRLGAGMPELRLPVESLVHQ